MRLDPNMLGVVATIHRRMDEMIELIKALSEEIKEIRQTGVAINLQVANSDDEEESGGEEESGEESSESSDSANTWP